MRERQGHTFSPRSHDPRGTALAATILSRGRLGLASRGLRELDQLPASFQQVINERGDLLGGASAAVDDVRQLARAVPGTARHFP